MTLPINPQLCLPAPRRRKPVTKYQCSPFTVTFTNAPIGTMIFATSCLFHLPEGGLQHTVGFVTATNPKDAEKLAVRSARSESRELRRCRLANVAVHNITTPGVAI